MFDKDASFTFKIVSIKIPAIEIAETTKSNKFHLSLKYLTP
jgi:hypothetical protein